MTYRLHVLARCIAAILGGYAVSSLFSIAFVNLLVNAFEYPKGVSVLTAAMLSYVLFFLVFILCFSPIRLSKLLFLLMFSILCLAGTAFWGIG